MSSRDTPNPYKGLFSESTIILIAVLCLTAGYSDQIKDFCNPLGHIEDAKSMLGEKGFVVTWLRVQGIASLVLPFVIFGTSVIEQKVYFYVSVVVVLIFFCVWGVISIDIIWSDDIPAECKNYLMGNNYPYVVMNIVSMVYLIHFCAIAFFILIVILHVSFVPRPTTRDDAQVNDGNYEPRAVSHYIPNHGQHTPNFEHMITYPQQI